ncbi:MAG: phage portal protein, partial [Kiritimatiellae bacterium]|nr:phage portal protein [Kiritimatiellia bacterium]
MMVQTVEAKTRTPVRLGVFQKPALRRADVRALVRRRVRAGFDSAETTDNNRRHWARADALSADAAASPEVRRTLRNRARYEVANNSYARGIVLTLANDTVGTGPRLQMLSEDPFLNRTVETEFHSWALAVGLASKLRTMRMARSQDGEAFAVLAFNPFVEHDVQLDMLLIEADQVASPWRHIMDEHEVDGLILDDYGNPIAYRVMKNHPGGTYRMVFDDFTTVPAPSMIHVFRQDRPGQHRGIPEITPALPLFAQLRRFTLAVLSAAEAAADFAGILYTDAPANGEADAVEPMDLIELERNMLMTMPGGWKMSQVEP